MTLMMPSFNNVHCITHGPMVLWVSTPDFESRDPTSNLGGTLCVDIFIHSFRENECATERQRCTKSKETLIRVYCWMSNPQSSDPKSDALSIRPRGLRLLTVYLGIHIIIYVDCTIICYDADDAI